jgi:sugar O-acyltransferase (sialic acid O-acetyltransferase NeuD family)
MCNKIRLVIVGGGGHGRSSVEAASLSGKFNVVGVLDDTISPGSFVLETPVLGPIASRFDFKDCFDEIFVAIGNNFSRENLYRLLVDDGFNFATIIHPTAVVSPTAKISEGSILMAGSIVSSNVRIGSGAILNCGAIVDHDCTVDDFGHLGVNASMAGASSLGRGAWMQAGSALSQGALAPAGTVLLPNAVFLT